MALPLRRRLRDALLGVIVAAVAVPLAFSLTLLALPLWRWIEANYGIESIGHHGPNEWCYYTVYGLVLLLAALAWRGLNKN